VCLKLSMFDVLSSIVSSLDDTMIPYPVFKVHALYSGLNIKHNQIIVFGISFKWWSLAGSNR
ncbi:hypothetical protein, partial [Halobacillus sp. BAB-2008]|uniref:hypothetical protein n=1 Tax=Halobacillus sp. BAB-2008 TaxID=1246484 RepID=UPI0019D3660B